MPRTAWVTTTCGWMRSISSITTLSNSRGSRFLSPLSGSRSILCAWASTDVEYGNRFVLHVLVGLAAQHMSAETLHWEGRAGARRNIPRQAVFEVLQEAHDPPLESLFDGFSL
jgi:hypothetical protein